MRRPNTFERPSAPAREIGGNGSVSVSPYPVSRIPYPHATDALSGGRGWLSARWPIKRYWKLKSTSMKSSAVPLTA